MKGKKIIPLLMTAVLALLLYACQSSEKTAEADADVNLEMLLTTQSKEALQQFDEGLLARDLGDRERARPYFDKAIELDSNFAMAYAWRAFSAGSAKEFADNVKMANAKNKNLSDAEQLVVDLANSFLEGDADKRLVISKTMVEKYPNLARAHMFLGQAQENVKDHINARKSFEKAIELNPEWIGGYSALGNSYIFNEPKDLAKAEQYMKKTVELLPNESRMHIALGDVYRAQQDLEKALLSYKKASELAPNDRIAYSKAGHANTFLGNYEEARKDYEKSAENSDFRAAGLNFTAFTHLYAGDHAKGLAWLKEQAMNLDKVGLSRDRLVGQQNNMMGNCMWIAYHLGDVDELKAILDHVQPLDDEIAQNIGSKEAKMRNNARKNFREGLIAVSEGNFTLANEKAETQKADLAGINDPTKLEDYHFLKGEIAMGEKKYAEAVSHFEQADLDNIYPKYKLAIANKNAGNDDKANQLLKEISTYNFNEVGYALVRKEVQSMIPSES
jgi:tetratricopeptide (TPR) repeat protein